MTVSELIALLANYPPTARVVVDGYKGGLGDVIELADAKIRADTNPDVNEHGHHLMDADPLGAHQATLAQLKEHVRTFLSFSIRGSTWCSFAFCLELNLLAPG